MQEFEWFVNVVDHFFRTQLLPVFLEYSPPPALLGMHEKAGQELVSELDYKLQDRFLEFARTNLDGIPCITEENCEGKPWPPKEGDFLGVDPLDGTHNYLLGGLTFGTMLFLVLEGKVAFSAIFLPLQQKSLGNGAYFAGQKQGAWRKHGSSLEEIVVSQESALNHAFLLTEGSSRSLRKNSFAQKAIDTALRHRTGLSSCYSGTLVASGGNVPAGASALVSIGNKPFDNLPLCLLVEEAGGNATDLKGNPWSLENYPNLVFSNGLVHDELLALAL